MDGASAHSTEAAVYVAIPASSGRRRPRASLSGPVSSCPSASPIRQAVSVSCADEAVVCRSAASAGRPGTYMSRDSAANALNAPSSTIGCPAALAALPPATAPAGESAVAAGPAASAGSAVSADAGMRGLQARW